MFVEPDLSGGRNPADDAFAPRKTDMFNEGMAVYLIDPRREVSFTLILYALDGEAGAAGQNRATVSVNLPDGLVATSLDMGGARSDTVFQSNHLTFEQIEPFSLWRYRFDGPAAVVPRADTLRRVIDDPLTATLNFDLRAKCATPPWSPPSTVFATATAQALGESPIFGFYAQNLRFEGQMEIGGRRFDLRGFGWRHHVRGRPWGREIAGHHFVHVLFDSGRAFGLQVAALESGDASRHGYIFEDGVLVQASVRVITDWDRLIYSAERVAVVLACDDRIVEIEGETLNNVSVSSGRGAFGVDLTDKGARFMTFADAKWVWDGESGYGAWERSLKVSALR